MRAYIQLLLAVCAVAVPIVLDEHSNVTYKGIMRNNLDVFLGIKYIDHNMLWTWTDETQDMAKILLARIDSSHPIFMLQTLTLRSMPRRMAQPAHSH